MNNTEGVVRKLLLKYEGGWIDLIEMDGIFYLGAQGSKEGQP